MAYQAVQLYFFQTIAAQGLMHALMQYRGKEASQRLIQNFAYFF